jgi:ADP-ribose pyrophosphatase YjhB (NUDIX family)
MVAIAVARRSARAILIDDDGNLVLIKRTKPGVRVYWTTAGGGVDDTDASPEAAMHREIFEELGATATGATQVFLVSTPTESGVKIQHVFVARLTSLDLSLRNGPEFANPAAGRYDPDRVSLLTGEALAAIDLRSAQLKAFILANREALLAEAGLAAGLALFTPEFEMQPALTCAAAAHAGWTSGLSRAAVPAALPRRSPPGPRRRRLRLR